MNKPGSHLILNSDNDQMRVNLEVRTESNMSVNLRLGGSRTVYSMPNSFHKVDRFRIDENITMVIDVGLDQRPWPSQ